MTDISQQIQAVKKELRETPHHKHTDHYIGRMRAKLARLENKQVETDFKSKGGGGGGYAVKKQGDATVVLVGPPSVGKSTLLNKLTNAKSKIAPYSFTTVSVIPGMMDYHDAKIQILDVPGLIKGAEKGKGRGREVLSVIRGADLLILMVDVIRIKKLNNIRKTLEGNGIRIDKSPPDIVIEKKLKGGITIYSNIKQEMNKKTINDIGQEFGYKNADITIKEKLTFPMLIDAFSANRIYLPSISVVNKSDLLEKDLPKKTKMAENTFLISAEKEKDLDALKKAIWKKLNFRRIYLVKKDDQPNLESPLITKEGDSLKEVKKLIGTEFAEENKKAVIWGEGAKFPGQEVSLKTKVKEGMQVRFINS